MALSPRAKAKDCMRFVVQSKEDIIKKIIPHFNNYPLKTSKQLNFKSFKEASEIVRKGEHLELKGLNKIIEIKNKMNRNRSFAFARGLKATGRNYLII